MPKREEVLAQMERIISSKTFEHHPKLVDLLKVLVIAALDTTPIDEDKLGRDLFARPEDWIREEQSAVGERKRLMRKALGEYYGTEGHEDPVNIEFPKYGRPKFSYNPHAEAAEYVRR